MKTDLDINLLEQYVSQRYINKVRHNDADICIYNYTKKTQYENFWNEITINCRGLILDSNHNIVQRCLQKIFHYDQLNQITIPEGPFEVYEKYDGSYGVLYWINDIPYISTRGHFYSDYALRATNILHNKYAHTFNKLDKSKTYIFEIIYPEAQIVVNYGGYEALVLLAVIDIETGKDEPLVDIGFPVALKYNNFTDIKELLKNQRDNAEGYIIKFSNGLRVKAKFDEYMKLHRVVTNTSNIGIWKHLKDGLPLSDLYELVPDEFYDFLQETYQSLMRRYDAVELVAKHLYIKFPTRKETAVYNQQQTPLMRSILWCMYDGKDYREIIWDEIKPDHLKPLSVTKIDHEITKI